MRRTGFARGGVAIVGSSLAFALLGACGGGGIGAGGAASASGGEVGGAHNAQATVGSGATSGGVGGGGGAGGAAPGTPPFFGANVEPGGVVFRVWAPHATAASVQGDFAATPVAMSPIAGGSFEAHVGGAHAGSTYAFVLETPSGELTRIDPYCRELSSDACVVVDPSTYAWQTKTFAPPKRADAVVYEMHVGSFRADPMQGHGTLASARDGLASLADLGVNVIEVMPVQDSGSGAATWGYNPQLYFAPKPGYGTSSDMRSFVDQAHSLGMAVWIDTVLNHTDGWSKAPLRCFDGECASAGIYFFPAGPYATTPWGPRPSYIEPNAAGMLLDSVDAWMDELHCDGFRFDSVSNIRALDGSGTVPGGKDLLVLANDHIHARGGLSVAEDLKGYAKITDTKANGGFGFDAQWDGFGWNVMDTLAVASDDARDLGKIQSALQSNYDGDAFARLLFTEDHDTVGNGGSRLPDRIDAANPTSWAARKRSMLGAVLLMTAPGVPMIFQGQEALATGTFANPATPLAAPSGLGLPVRAFYRDMIRLRRNLDGGSGGLSDDGIEVFHRNDPAKVIAYRRHGSSGEDVVVIVNLKNKAYTEYDIGVDTAGPWTVRLNTDDKAYSADFADGQTGTIATTAVQKDNKPFTLPLRLGAYSAMVLTP